MFQQSNFYSSPILADLPPQMIPLSQKGEKWRKDCMNALESVARGQISRNMKMIENLEMVNGRFIPGHYYEGEEYQDLISSLQKEFNLPKYLRHYDIMSEVINTLSGEWQTRPDVYRVREHGEKASNEFLRQQTSMLKDYVNARIQAEVAKKMLEMGVDENGAANLPPDQQEQYMQQIEELKAKLTPPEIQDYMRNDWMTAGEMWGQHQLQLDKKRYRLSDKEKNEFEYKLKINRYFRHFYLTATGYDQETWNPINVFVQETSENIPVEDRDYAGRSFLLTTAGIIDRYGHKMKKTDIEKLQRYRDKKDKKWNYAPGTEYVFNQYMVPFQDYPTFDILNQTGQAGHITGNIPHLDSSVLNQLYSGKFFSETPGLFLVVEGYWKSQKKIGKLAYINPETGVLTKLIIDENIVIPPSFKQTSAEEFNSEEEQEPNTVIWTWINEVWKGIKICVKNQGGFEDDIYLNIGPNEFQFKGDYNPYGCKLPVCGDVCPEPSVADRMKPHQIGFNVAMNQAYIEMQKDVGKFIVMDVNMFSDMKDWGGSNAYEKFMLIAKELGVTVIDTSLSKTAGAAAAQGGHMPKEIDLDASARILSRLKIAEAFQMFALKQVGFNEYRLGQQGVTSTATGIQQGTARSFAQTESIFTDFSSYIQRCHKMNLDIAQFVQSQNRDITVMHTKSDMSRGFIKLSGTDLLLSDLHIYVWNSQEEVRQLETMKQLALSNNTMGASFSDLAQVITANSPQEIVQFLKKADENREAVQQQQLELQNKQIEAKAKADQDKLTEEARQFDVEWGPDGTRERIAYITTFNRQTDNTKDVDANAVPDVLEYDKLDQKAEADQSKIQAQTEKNQIDREKNMMDQQLKREQLQVDREKLKSQERIQAQETETARIMKDKELKSSKNKKKDS